MIRVWAKHSVHGYVAYAYSYFTNDKYMSLVAYSRCIYKGGIDNKSKWNIGIIGMANRVVQYFKWKDGLSNRMMYTDGAGKIDSHLVVIPHMI